MNSEEKVSHRLLIPNSTAFIANFCIMVLELTAARLIARHLGVSLYTWTSVIGVVLGGIALGNYIGGRIADRFDSQKSLSLLFILASVACVTVPVLNQIMGEWVILISLSWPVRITLHVACIFLLPSTLLGMISPVVAKFALDQGLKTGQTVGDVYAWGAIGSIIGTFFTGFFLIATLGTIKVIWTLAILLAIIGILYRRRTFLPYLWLGILTILFFLSLSSKGWALIREPLEEGVIYAKDSQYSFIKVVKEKQNPKVYELNLDTLTQTQMNTDEPTNLEYAYPYYQTFAEIVKQFKPEGMDLSLLSLGGGGYILPRYLEEAWPNSHIEVVEIDPEVTHAAQKYFNLSDSSNMIIHHMDARNYVEDLIRANLAGGKSKEFDFIVLDVFTGGVAIPYQLVTDEFNQKIAQLLADDGLYTINLIDLEVSPKFLKSMIETLKNTFSQITVILPGEKNISQRNYYWRTYVLIASQKELNKEILNSSEFKGRRLSETELKSYVGNSKGVILTDDFAPTDNLLKEVFAKKGERKLCNVMMQTGMKLIEQMKFSKAIAQFERVLRINPDFPGAHVNIGSLSAMQGKDIKAIEHFLKALEADPEFKSALIGLGNAFDRKGKLDKAIDMYRRVLAIDPNIPVMHVSLGNALLKQENIDEAIEHYQIALEISPEYESARKNLGVALRNKARLAEWEKNQMLKQDNKESVE